MEKKGLQLTAEEIYSINTSSLKDAIVSLGGGFCTGEIISDQGLMLTNHHCAYSYIQKNSTVENDILTDGFWAQSNSEELPNDGLYAQFLVRMEDVTKTILKDVKNSMSEDERTEVVDIAIAAVISDAKQSDPGNYDVKVKPFFEGNEYYLFVYETYHDVRLVGNPPESIGKFGGSTDNWMWPRHTGDFALFRIYTGPDGKPAKYSKDNIPLNPRHHLPISLDGIQENDFAMVIGYPGSTRRYLSSFGVKEAIESTNPARVKIRGKRLDIMKTSMDNDPSIRLAYASKHAEIGNYWKYFIGQTAGLQNLNIYDDKVNTETKLTTWINSKKSRVKKFGTPVHDIQEAYQELTDYNFSFYILYEAGFGIEFVKHGYKLASLIHILKSTQVNQQEKDKKIELFRTDAEKFFKDYSPEIDKKVFAAMMEIILSDLDEAYIPEAFKSAIFLEPNGDLIFEDFTPTHDDNLAAFSDYVFNNSIIVNRDKLLEFFKNPEVDKLLRDPGYEICKSIYHAYSNVSRKRGAALAKLTNARRVFIAALREMENKTDFYPDANSTMRISYGQVQGYNVEDAGHYDYKTSLKGVMKKGDTLNPEFTVPSKLKDIFKSKNYGPYGANGELYVAFITDNDITGGNSGSPVINAHGQLIGIAFDGNWEAMSGDIAFEPEFQRCINLDVRYALLIIDKFAEAKHLIDEMTLMRDGVILSESQ